MPSIHDIGLGESTDGAGRAPLSTWHPTAAEYHSLLPSLLRIADLLTVSSTGVFGYFIRNHSFDLSLQHWMFGIFATILAGTYLQCFQLYSTANMRYFGVQLRKIAISWLLAMVSVLAVVHFTKTSADGAALWIVYWSAGAAAVFAATRFGLIVQLSRWRREKRLTLNIAIVGSCAFASDITQRWSTIPSALEHRIVGVFHDRSCCDAADSELPTVDDLMRRARVQRIDEILVALPAKPDSAYGALLHKLKTLPTNVNLCLDMSQCSAGALPSYKSFKTIVASGSVLLTVWQRPLTGWKSVVKRLEDLVLGAGLLIVFAPVMLLIALLVKLDSPGPVFFRQRRFGFNNETIDVYKFRTMYHRPGLDGSIVQVRRNDPRVTRLGRLLRRTSLDELPQLINVVQGEMSLVGPRPHPITLNEHYAKIIDGYHARHRVKPGITGWAQVNGLRGETDTLAKMHERVQFDVFYIDNWSLLLDLKILLKTVFVGFVHRNAY